MTIETDLFTTLSTDGTVSGLVGTRIYSMKAPENATVPRIDYQNVAGSRINTLPGVGDGIRKRIQINCHAATYAGAKALAAAVVSALEGNGYLELEYDLYDPDTQIQTVIIDWSFMA